MTVLLDMGLVALGVGLAELGRWLRGLRDPLRMTVEDISDAEAGTIQEMAARSRRTQEQMRRTAYQSNLPGGQR